MHADILAFYPGRKSRRDESAIARGIENAVDRALERSCRNVLIGINSESNIRYRQPILMPDPVFPASGVFRSGLAAFAKLFADKYAPDNVRMNNVLPGFIDSLPEKTEFKTRIPMERYGKVEEVAATIAFLASDAAGYITGQNIRVDGGITRSV